MPHVRPTRRALALVAIAPLLACSEPTAVGGVSLRCGAPNFEGIITAPPTGPQQQWVAERTPVEQPCDDRVYFSAHDRWTEVWRADGTRGSVADLAVGREVAMWFEGPVLASCPGQVGAGAIVLR